MGDLNILVWNCGGLNAPHKRARTFTLLKRKNLDSITAGDTPAKNTKVFSSADTKTKGVAIVARRNLPLKIKSSWADESGRIVIAQIEFHSKKIALVSACAPNDFNIDFYNLITTKMLELTDCSFIVRANFNAVYNILGRPVYGHECLKMLG